MLDFPEYANAVLSGEIIGGLLVDGFSININQFSLNCIKYLEESGVNFNWNVCAKSTKDNGGIISGLSVKENGKDVIMQADNYSINLGAYGGGFSNLGLEKSVGGVAGRWVLVSGVKIKLPTKLILRKRPDYFTFDNNITPVHYNGKYVLAISGGCVFTGSKFDMIDQDYELVDLENKRTIELLFGDLLNIRLCIPKNSCIRSYTCNDEPLFDSKITSNGGVSITTSGTNTGTTTQSLYIAEKVYQQLSSPN